MSGKISAYRKRGPGRTAKMDTFRSLYHNRAGTKLVRKFLGEAAAERWNK